MHANCARHDVLAAAELASGQNTTAGKVISDFTRKALAAPISDKATWRNGFLVLPKRGGIVTTELVNRLAEADE
jgi:hypothetical protein